MSVEWIENLKLPTTPDIRKDVDNDIPQVNRRLATIIIHPENLAVDLLTQKPIRSLKSQITRDFSRIQSIRIFDNRLWSKVSGLGALPSLREVIWTGEAVVTVTLNKWLARFKDSLAHEGDCFCVENFTVKWRSYLKKLLLSVKTNLKEYDGEFTLKCELSFEDDSSAVSFRLGSSTL